VCRNIIRPFRGVNVHGGLEKNKDFWLSPSVLVLRKNDGRGKTIFHHAGRIMDNFYARNKKGWENRTLARLYARQDALHAPEKAILDSLQDSFKGRRLLDVGVGGGRTVPHLLKISADYIGIDYSSAMIEACRVRFPNVTFEVADMRRPLAFPNGRFDLVFFSFNGLDNLVQGDRLNALREFRRVLSPGGVFVFSSHNMGYVRHIRKPWSFDRLHPEPFNVLSPLKLIKRLPLWLWGIVRWRWNEKYVIHGHDYAVLNDGSEHYRLLQYYISIPAQIAQLKDCGFSQIKAYGLEGRELAPEDYVSCEDGWINYICS